MNLKTITRGLIAASIVAATATQLSGCCSAKSPSQAVAKPLTDAAYVELVDEIYESLSMEERVAQIHSVRPSMLLKDGKLDYDLCRELIPHGVGHLAQFACTQSMEAEEIREYIKELQEYIMSCTDQKIPAICHEELITGVSTKGATIYPQQIGVACSWNAELVELKSKYSSESLRAIGGQYALSPMVDVVRSQHFNRGEEGYGEDSYLGAVMANAFIAGLQGESLKDGVAATTKHFLGYGGGSNLPEKELIEEVLFPHEVAIRVTGSKSLMPGYHSFNGETAITNHYYLKDILGDYLAFDGVIVSDYFAISSKWAAKGDPNYAYVRCEKAINAGADLELCDLDAFRHLPEHIKLGNVSEKRFEEAVKKNLMMKARLGLLDKSPVLYGEGDIDLNKAEYAELAYELATQSVVLLKNNGVLPLKKSDKNIALVGPNAASQWAMFGDYTYPAHFAFFSYPYHSSYVEGGSVDLGKIRPFTLKQGLEQSVEGGVAVNYDMGCDWDSSIRLAADKGGDARIGLSNVEKVVLMLRTNSETPNWKRAMKLADDSDVVIAAMGENISLCGEGRNRKGIALPGEQERFVEELIDEGKPVVLVVFGGRAQQLSQKIMDGAAAIIQAWYPGQEGGRAVADILTGKVNPSGKLSTSYPATDSRKELCYNYGEQEMKGLIAFPFGYGLSYTTYDYSDIDSTTSVEIGKDEVKVSFTITNSGDMAGAEVAQLYISPAQATKNYKPIQLRGFERVELEAGESKRVTFTFDPTMLAYFDIETPGRAQGVWRTEPSKFVVKIGASSSDIRLTAPLELTGEAQQVKLRDYYLSTSSVN